MRQTLTPIFLLLSFYANAQLDTTKKLNEVVIKGYYNPQSLLRAIGGVSRLDSNQTKNQANSSLVGLINTAPGIRMEERSPGSYRLSLRGSVLRSPFGIRNVKIYMDDFPLTDASGNTYLNSLDATALTSLEIYKGPEASIFGANTGGAVLIGSSLNQKNSAELNLNTGSYGLFHQTAKVEQRYQNYNFNVVQGYQSSNGYRENSALNRKYVQTTHQYNYSIKGKAKAFVFYSDLAYETPGGLTLAELNTNPKSARPATTRLPGAIQQQAAIYNRTFFGGLANDYVFNRNFKHVIALFASYTDFKNPFITNFEKRRENNIGFRTFVEFNTLENEINYNLQAGFESAKSSSKITNFDNNNGVATAMQKADNLTANLNFAFIRANFDINKKLLIELGSSLNFFNYHYQGIFPIAIPEKRREFNTVLMPKFAASYLINTRLSWRATISKGYSPPTIAEVRASDQQINTNLQAEAGWNYESGLRYQSKDGRFNIDGTVFYFNLQEAIVRRLNNDNEYFINSGGTKQLGVELEIATWLIKSDRSHFLNGLQWRNALTYSHFRFNQFRGAQQNYSGNRLTGVPTTTLINSLAFDFKKEIYLFMQHNYTSTIPLNDANTLYAKAYHLVDLKTGLRNLKLGKIKFDLSFGINNLFDQDYSLGNDLNVTNDRYFNPAAGINYYTGLAVKL